MRGKPITYIAYPRNTDNRYNVWISMKGRCLNKNSEDYERYGGRGISVCNRWLASFDAFAADMGYRPSMNHSIERIDNDGDYTPENCIWATPSVQSMNKSTTAYVVVDGEKMPRKDAINRYGVGEDAIRRRKSEGWSDEQALGIARPPAPNDEKLREKHIGRKFGCFSVTAVSRRSDDRRLFLQVKCDCGDAREVRSDRLKNLVSKACARPGG